EPTRAWLAAAPCIRAMTLSPNSSRRQPCRALVMSCAPPRRKSGNSRRASSEMPSTAARLILGEWKKALDAYGPEVPLEWAEYLQFQEPKKYSHFSLAVSYSPFAVMKRTNEERRSGTRAYTSTTLVPDVRTAREKCEYFFGSWNCRYSA